MKKYRVWVSWEVGSYIDVEAESTADARQQVKATADLPEGAEYVSDSFRVNDVELMENE